MSLLGVFGLIALPIALVREQGQIAQAKAYSKAREEFRRNEAISKRNRYFERIEEEEKSGKKLNFERQDLYYRRYVLEGKRITNLHVIFRDQVAPKYDEKNPYSDPYDYIYCGKEKNEYGDYVLTSQWTRLSKARKDFEENEDFDWSYAYEEKLDEKYEKCYRQ